MIPSGPRTYAMSQACSSRAGDAANSVDEFAFDERGALDFEPEPDEERGRGIEVGDRDADVIERAKLTHTTRPSPTAA